MATFQGCSVAESLEAAVRNDLVPDQEFILQGSIFDTSVNLLIDRLKGICDDGVEAIEPFNDHEIVFLLKDFGAPPGGPASHGVQFRVRRALDYPENPYLLKYIGQPEVATYPAILRNSLDIPVQQNICEFLQELGAKVDFEFIAKGYCAIKDRIKVNVFKIYKIIKGNKMGQGSLKDNLEPVSMSHMVEVSATVTRGEEVMADEVRAFADQLKPLVNLEKVDYKRIPPV